MKAKRSTWDFDCAVIGGGPGGLCSALYLVRYRRKVGLFYQGTPRVRWAPKIHNLLGHAHGVSGKKLLSQFHEQLSLYPKLKTIDAQVKVRRYQSGFQITTEAGKIFTAKKVILATGIHDIQPELTNRASLRRAGLLRYCSVCDGYEMTNQPIAVLANDEDGIEKAFFIGTWTTKIRIIVPADFKISKRRENQIRAKGMRLIRCNVIRIVRGKKEGVTIHCADGRPFYAKVVYVELGCRVNDSAFAHLHGLHRTLYGFLTVTSEQKTSVRGLFAVGDCVNRLGQVSVALGQAAIAANVVHEELS